MFYLFIYFIWLCRVLVASGRLLSCGSLPPYLWQTDSLGVAGGLLKCGMRTLSYSIHVESSSLARD